MHQKKPPEQRLCEQCLQPFMAHRSTARFCQAACRVAFNRQQTIPSDFLIISCETCGRQSMPKNKANRFCSPACKQKAYRHRQQPAPRVEADLVRPDEYDIIHLGVSGGKDSTAVLLWLIYESGWPLDKVMVTFSDTANEDALTYAYIRYLSETVHPIETITPALGFFDLARKKKRFPSTKARFCTQHLKVIPSRSFVQDLQRDGRNVLLLNGVRRAEGHAGNDRGTAPAFEFDLEGFCAAIFRPILHWNLLDIWAIHRKYLDVADIQRLLADDPYLSPAHKDELTERMGRHLIPRNPIYDMGASRVGCYPCIHSRKYEVRSMAKYRPERIGFIEAQEGTVNPVKGISTFFAMETTPLRFRSKKITTQDGRVFMVPTIRDVVAWSQTAYGGKEQEVAIDPPVASACDIGGMCE